MLTVTREREKKETIFTKSSIPLSKAEKETIFYKEFDPTIEGEKQNNTQKIKKTFIRW